MIYTLQPLTDEDIRDNIAHVGQVLEANKVYYERHNRTASARETAAAIRALVFAGGSET